MSWRKFMNNAPSMGITTNLNRIIERAFSPKYLIFTNVTISVTLSSAGDFLEQTYEVYSKKQEKFCPKRNMQMAFSGVALGVLCHHWYNVLDKFIKGRSLEMVIKKLLLDQLIFSPIMILTFFGSLAILEKDIKDNFSKEVKDKFVTLYTAEWIVWPPAQIINFYFLPTRFRVLYDNTISLGYDVYTSQVKHRKSSQGIVDKTVSH